MGVGDCPASRVQCTVNITPNGFTWALHDSLHARTMPHCLNAFFAKHGFLQGALACRVLIQRQFWKQNGLVFQCRKRSASPSVCFHPQSRSPSQSSDAATAKWGRRHVLGNGSFPKFDRFGQHSRPQAENSPNKAVDGVKDWVVGARFNKLCDIFCRGICAEDANHQEHTHVHF